MDRDTATVPVVLCTGAVREVEALAPHLQDMGIGVVLKPFNIYHLVDVIAEALGAPNSASRG